VKTREQILAAVKSGDRKSEIAWVEARDFKRLVVFFPVSDWKFFCIEPVEKLPEEHPKWNFVKAGSVTRQEIQEGLLPEELTEENVLKHLKKDLEFSFYKALDKRGISSSLMYEVIKMWMWVLDDPLMDFKEYSMYGLPLYKAVAVKYGFENPIGDDEGSEEKYNEH
jgi:hypothetical protein